MPTGSRTTPPGGSFRGWKPEAVDFLRGIELDNSKAYWTACKSVYETAVLAPMLDLLAELAPEFGDGRVFRPYRDTRFSADKSPYKTNIAAHNDAAYITLSADSLGTGTGLYRPAPDQLARFRTTVAQERTGRELVKLVEEVKAADIEVSGQEVLKTAPRGYEKDHPRIELLRQKGLLAWKQWPVGAWLGTAKPRQRIVEFLHATGPLRRWLDKNVGPSDTV
jgi:uncharacterized protein (TIGR02453 family)